jgi:hypothetical protein
VELGVLVELAEAVMAVMVQLNQLLVQQEQLILVVEVEVEVIILP